MERKNFFLLLFLDWFKDLEIKTLKSSNLPEERQNPLGFCLTTGFYYVRWAVKNQVSYHEADCDHVPEADKEPRFTLGELNYDKTLVQVQIYFDWCSLPLSIMITKFWSVLH